MLSNMSAIEKVKLISSKQISPLELMEGTIESIEKLNPALNAFVALRTEQALDEARILTDRISLGMKPGPLAGIPVAVKDLEDVRGMVTSFGSIPFKDNLAQRDSIQVARLKKAGAIVVGKTNTPEFGSTGFTKNRLFGVTRNPWNLNYTPGGSSGGSAAAVVSGMVSLATGSDAGGSIRIPASYSGCFGLKPSFGRIPLEPTAFLNLTRIWNPGPLTGHVSDAALYLDCTAGYDAEDPQSLPFPITSFLNHLHEMPSRLKIGFSPTLGYARVEKNILRLVEQAVKQFENMGHRVELWDGPLPDVSAAWSLFADFEIYAKVRSCFEKIRPEMGRALASSLDTVASLSTAALIESQAVRSNFNEKLTDFFSRFNLLLTPTVPTQAFPAKGPPPSEIDGQAVPLLGAVAFTYPFNVSGHPAASVPAGFTGAGLPAGLQIVGPRHQESLVLQAAYAYEKMVPWHDHRPADTA